MKRKSISVIAVILVIVGVVGVGTYFANAYIKKNAVDSVVKNNKVLYIGIPLSVKSTDGSSYPVELDVNIHSKDFLYSDSWNTEDNYSDFIQDDEYENVGFINLTTIFSNISQKQDVDVWNDLDSENYISCSTTWLGFENIKSQSKMIDDSGLWFVNVATEEGGDVQILHSYVYEKYVWNISKKEVY